MKIKEFKLEKYIGIFLLIFFVFIYIINKKICKFKKNMENMSNIDDKEITNAINRYYLSNDFERTMTSITQKIQINGPQIVGDIIITGNVKADGKITNQNTSFSDFDIKIEKKIIEMKVKADKKIAAEKAAAEKAAAGPCPPNYKLEYGVCLEICAKNYFDRGFLCADMVWGNHYQKKIIPPNK